LTNHLEREGIPFEVEMGPVVLEGHRAEMAEAEPLVQQAEEAMRAEFARLTELWKAEQ
jgi:hypothetical protein